MCARPYLGSGETGPKDRVTALGVYDLEGVCVCVCVLMARSGGVGCRQPFIWSDTDLNEMSANHIPLASTQGMEKLKSITFETFS